MTYSSGLVIETVILRVRPSPVFPDLGPGGDTSVVEEERPTGSESMDWRDLEVTEWTLWTKGPLPNSPARFRPGPVSPFPKDATGPCTP